MGRSQLKCLVSKCRDPVFNRGICLGHYNAAAKLVQRDLTSWRKLEKAGKVTKPSGKRRKRNASKKYFLGDK